MKTASNFLLIIYLFIHREYLFKKKRFSQQEVMSHKHEVVSINFTFNTVNSPSIPSRAMAGCHTCNPTGDFWAL